MALKVLCAGFKGNNNSSKVLLDTISRNSNIKCLYMDNDFKTSECQLIDTIQSTEYDFIFAFGQKPVIKSIYIEKAGASGIMKRETQYDFSELKAFLEKHYKVKISENAGNYLCNNIYYKGLNYIYENKLKTKMLFIHIPYINNIDIELFSKTMINYITDTTPPAQASCQ